MADIMGLMKQAQKLQARMSEIQAELEALEVEGIAGGGLVRVTLTAKGQMKGIGIDASLLKPTSRKSLKISSSRPIATPRPRPNGLPKRK